MVGPYLASFFIKINVIKTHLLRLEGTLENILD